MNDELIRKNFHRHALRRYCGDAKTLVVDELGLRHGKCRADIAVVNGGITGYEIKSDEDSLGRLSSQIKTYNSVFDRAFVITGTKHLNTILVRVPKWWGVILCRRDSRGGLKFETRRKAQRNESVVPMAVAQLLWKTEAVEILQSFGAAPQIARLRRSKIYRRLTNIMGLPELQRRVREQLKKRKNWRRPEPLFLSGD